MVKKLVHLGVRIKYGDAKQFQVCTCVILGLVIYEYKLGDAIMMLHIFNMTCTIYCENCCTLCETTVTDKSSGQYIAISIISRC